MTYTYPGTGAKFDDRCTLNLRANERTSEARSASESQGVRAHVGDVNTNRAVPHCEAIANSLFSHILAFRALVQNMTPTKGRPSNVSFWYALARLTTLLVAPTRTHRGSATRDSSLAGVTSCGRSSLGGIVGLSWRFDRPAR